MRTIPLNSKGTKRILVNGKWMRPESLISMELLSKLAEIKKPAIYSRLEKTLSQF